MSNFFSIEEHNKDARLTKSDFVIGSFISVGLLVVFSYGSSGMSLIATFVPALVLVWLLFAFLYFKKIELPGYNLFLPLYFLTLGWQFIHFTEEFLTDFKEVFPLTYGGQPYPANTFVAFNMFSYFVFIVSPVLVYFKGLKFLFIPVLFFVVYGAMGNAIAHSWWSIYFGHYFSGLYTSLLYWILGSVLLKMILKSKKLSLIYIIALTAILVVTLTILMR